MNPGFAIAATTVALADRVHALIGDAVPGARVTTLNPGSEELRGGQPTVNLYMFRTIRNGYVSNRDLPTRGPGGAPKASPTLMLDLDYMVTFYGEDARLDPQRLLGLVAGGFNADPYIDRTSIRSSIAATPWLGASVPEPPADQIRITPMNMTPDQIARLWGEFVGGNYQLTQLYTLTPVALEVELPVSPVLPVRRLGLVSRPDAPIRIGGIVNAADPALPISGGCRMAIRIADPAQPGYVVQLDGVPAAGVTPGFDAGGYAALLVDLTASEPAPLRAGPITVQVTRAANGNVVARSALVEATIVPGLASAPVADSGQVVATMALTVSANANTAILLYATGTPGAASARIDCVPRTADGTKLAAPLTGIPAGAYLVGVEIDGLTSVLDYDYAAGRYTGPMIAVAEAAP